jgi:hypothetical protein
LDGKSILSKGIAEVVLEKIRMLLASGSVDYDALVAHVALDMLLRNMVQSDGHSELASHVIVLHRCGGTF